MVRKNVEKEVISREGRNGMVKMKGVLKKKEDF